MEVDELISDREEPIDTHSTLGNLGRDSMTDEVGLAFDLTL